MSAAPSGDAVEVLRAALIEIETMCRGTASAVVARHALAATSRAATVAKDGGKPVATVIKKGADRQWMSEDLGSLPDGVYSLYLAPKPEASAANQQAGEVIYQHRVVGGSPSWQHSSDRRAHDYFSNSPDYEARVLQVIAAPISEGTGNKEDRHGTA